MPDEQRNEPTDEELIELASRELLTRVRGATSVVDTRNYMDVDPAEVLRATDEPDFAFINTYRVDPGSGRQMRIKVLFNDVDDIALGLAYQGALRNAKTSKETRQRLEKKLWRACVAGPALVLSDGFYAKAKPQMRAELTTHILVRLGLENAKLSGLGQDAFVPAGTLVQTQVPADDLLEEDAPPEIPAQDASPEPTADSSPQSGGATLTPSSTPSSTSSTSRGGTGSARSRSSAGGPPPSSRRRGQQGTPNASKTG